MVIAVIGDSIAYGQFLDDPLTAWPYLLGEPDIIVVAKPGDTTRLGLESFPAIQTSGASHAIIQFGHNDANHWQTDNGLPRVSMTAFKANLIEMLDRCRAFGIVPLLCTITPSYRPDPHPADCDRYDRVIRRVADDENARLVDVRMAFSAELDSRNLVMEDGLHLTVAGHRVYADAVRQALDLEGRP